ncbi:hypothetical protein NUW54_g7808 [Trametes sanguinea]|uniref:Uncharacterized protein n=1 Tax=Trametes sanguinea TaxID=158606 RepID=A0ACC1PJD1_9APHY|nr:hypothetical protein NUW54_g7808 [Trametes sanguinea]
MSGTRLPSVRLPAIVAGQAVDEEGSDAVVVELPASNRFGIAWPAEPPPPMAAPAERPAAVSLSSSEGETDISEEEQSDRRMKPARMEESEESESDHYGPEDLQGAVHAPPLTARTFPASATDIQLF